MAPPDLNLTRQPTPFVGREEEIAAIGARLTNPDCRLLTLVGPGGIGKTRLAVQAAAQTQDAFPHGAHFVPLQSVSDVTYLVPAIADAVGFSLSGRGDPEVQLHNYLQDKEMLLLLDNFEQLLPAGGTTPLLHLLAAAAGVTLLVTSREVLNLQEEWLYPVRGLPVPPSVHAEDLTAYGAVQLFLDRARRVRPDFTPDEDPAGVVRICQLVEGAPLALELAASWLKTLRCAAIAAEIQRNLDFLATRLRDVPERHRSIQAVFDHSWQSLRAEEQRTFRRLSVFRDGARRDAAEAVAAATLPILSALVDKSLLQREADGRYHVHELLRQYGEEKLHAEDAEATRTHRRHCAYYAAFLHDREGAINGREQQQAIGDVAAELENVRAAWQWAVAHADVDAIADAATTFFLFCQLQSHYREGAEALAAASASLAQQPASEQRDRTLARLYNHEGWLRIRVGEFERAQAVLEKSREIYARPGLPPPPHMGGDPRSPLAILATIQGDYDRAVALGDAVRRDAETRDDRQNLSFAHYVLTAAKSAQGAYEAAQRHAERACALARATGNRWFLAHPLNEWGHVERALGNYDEARKHYQASYAIKETFDDPEGMAVALNHLGDIALLQKDYSEARERFRRSCAIYQDINDAGGLATSLKGLAQVAGALQEYETARERFRRALDIALDIRFLPLVFSLFIDVDGLLQHRDARRLSVALLTLVERHPASDQETKTQARQRLAQHEARLSGEAFAGAVARGEGWDLDAAATALQAELSTPAGEGAKETPSTEDQPLAEPLTERELEVLHLMAQGHTNAQIAEELIIALGTVKWYASEIYGKLDVSNRTEAAARARELGLLSTKDTKGH